MLKIEALNAYSDNYIWLLTTNEGLVVVDPGDSQPVEDYLGKYNLEISDILITHHHFDHTGGVEKLDVNSSLNVYGPADSIFTGINKELKEGDEINVIGINFSIIEIPGHTLDHIAYYSENNGQPILFCGDTLFAGGCGRVFEGTYDQMYESLNKLKNLPANTTVYCGHEYTLSNLKFALEVDEKNMDLKDRYNHCVNLRKDNLATVPSSLSIELETNPFLRSHDKSIQNNIMQKLNLKRLPNDKEIFKAIREWKDNA
jgi:hydroxyacylglutathione hydrolase